MGKRIGVVTLNILLKQNLSKTLKKKKKSSYN